MAGWHHWLDGCESEWTPGVGDGQGGLVCFDSWGRKESDTTEQLNWTELRLSHFHLSGSKLRQSTTWELLAQFWCFPFIWYYRKNHTTFFEPSCKSLNTTVPLNEMRVCLYCYELMTKTVTGDRRRPRKTKYSPSEISKVLILLWQSHWPWSHHLHIIMFLSSIAALVRSLCTQNNFWIQYKTEDRWGVRTAVGVHTPPFQASLISPPPSSQSCRFRDLKWIVADLVHKSRRLLVNCSGHSPHFVCFGGIVVQLPSRVRLFAALRTAAHQPSLSFTISQSWWIGGISDSVYLYPSDVFPGANGFSKAIRNTIW